MRQLDVISDIILSESQKILLHYQKKHLLDNDSSSDDDGEEKQMTYNMKMLGNKNIIARGIYLQFLKQTLKKVSSKQDLTIIDKKILVGLFSKKIQGVFEEEKEKYESEKNSEQNDKHNLFTKKQTHRFEYEDSKQATKQAKIEQSPENMYSNNSILNELENSLQLKSDTLPKKRNQNPIPNIKFQDVPGQTAKQTARIQQQSYGGQPDNNNIVSPFSQLQSIISMKDLNSMTVDQQIKSVYSSHEISKSHSSFSKDSSEQS